VHYPKAGEEYFQRLRYASMYLPAVTLEPAPIEGGEQGLVRIAETARYVIYAHALDHGVPTYGYRIEERAGRRFVTERLSAAGITGPAVAVLARDGAIEVRGRTVTLEEVTVARPGAAFAFVMDTRPCPGAVALARDVDLLVMEATYTSADQQLATSYAHSSAADAARVAREAGARALAITHFSQRYASSDTHLAEAREIFPNTLALEDFGRVRIPRRR
jgi:ribonuclease Z